MAFIYLFIYFIIYFSIAKSKKVGMMRRETMMKAKEEFSFLQ